jgi:hypothetical protein
VNDEKDEEFEFQTDTILELLGPMETPTETKMAKDS